MLAATQNPNRSALRAVAVADGSPDAVTMSSLEISELTGKRHPDVLRDIRNMLEPLGLAYEQFCSKAPSEGGRPITVANLPRRETLILVSGYSVELRARIIDRLEELERAVKPPIAANQNAALAGREARLQFRMGLSLAKMLGLSGSQAAFSANGLALKTTGVDVLGAMGVKHLVAPQQEVLLSPTEVGERLGEVSARRINVLLSTCGFQVGAPGAYEPTAKGIDAGGVMVDVAKSHSTGTARQLRWASGIVEHLRPLMGAN